MKKRVSQVSHPRLEGNSGATGDLGVKKTLRNWAQPFAELYIYLQKAAQGLQ